MRTLIAAIVLASTLAACSGREDDAAGSNETTTITSPADSATVTTASGVETTSASGGETGADADGDGVDDGIDNCPNDNNPDQRDVCSSTTIAPGGACTTASLFVVRTAELDRPLLAVAFVDAAEADAPACGEGEPIIIPPSGWREILTRGDVVYLLADEALVDEPGGGVEIPDADFDKTRRPEPLELGPDEVAAVIEGALDGPAASEVAAAVNEAAAETLPSDTWRRVVELNPTLEGVVPGTDQVATEGRRD